MKIKDILKEGEGYKQEFKESFSGLDRTMVAFANASGGTIFIGAGDEGKIHSTRLTNRLKAQITDMASNCDPPIKVKVTQQGPLIGVIVEEGDNKPYACREGFFIRNGATTQKLSRQEILELTVKLGRLQFDRMYPMTDCSERDISKESLHQFVKKVSLENVFRDMGTALFLESLGLAQRQRGRLLVSHAGILLLAKNPQIFVPQAILNYTRYQGSDKSSIVQRELYTGSLLTQVETLMADMLQNIPTGYTFDKGLSRTERPHYPPYVLREAVVNAVMHRDYFETGADIGVDHFSDRIEVSNPGELIGALTIENLGRRSLRRNPLIADMLHRLGWVEKLGSGIVRMRNLMSEWHLKAPLFSSEGGFFSVTLFGPQAFIDESRIAHLPERERLFLIERNLVKEPFGSHAYSHRFGITLRTAQNDLSHLVKEGFIIPEGEGKSRRYRFQ